MDFAMMAKSIADPDFFGRRPRAELGARFESRDSNLAPILAVQP
jgi:hypothetical protein